jgi:hypothetical protein
VGNLNKNEIGQKIRINLSEDISLATPTLILEPQLGVKKVITTGVTIPAVNVTVGNETLNANEYVEYTTIDGDLDYIGQWRFKAKLSFSASDIRSTDYQFFPVLS